MSKKGDAGGERRPIQGKHVLFSVESGCSELIVGDVDSSANDGIIRNFDSLDDSLGLWKRDGGEVDEFVDGSFHGGRRQREREGRVRKT